MKVTVTRVREPTRVVLPDQIAEDMNTIRSRRRMLLWAAAVLSTISTVSLVAAVPAPVACLTPLAAPSVIPCADHYGHYPRDTSIPCAAPPPCTDSQVLHNLVERCYDDGRGESTPPLEVDRLNEVIHRLGREVQNLNQKSKDVLNEKIRGVSQIKKLRDGLKSCYSDIFFLQNAILTYQKQLKELQCYLKENKSRIVVVDNNSLGQLYGLVKNLQSVTDNICTTNNKPCPRPM